MIAELEQATAISAVGPHLGSGKEIEVSIIVPIYNEAKHIGKCLESLVAQDYPKDRLEVLLVDGNSTDETGRVIAAFAIRNTFIRVLKNPRRSVPHALNLGVTSANGEFIIRMDAHAEYPPDYLSKCLMTLRSSHADNVGGCVVTLPGASTLTAQAIAVATSHPFGVGNSKFRTGANAGFVDTVPFGAFRRTLFDKIGLFAEPLSRNQDIEFNSRISRTGGKIYLNPDIQAYYFNRSTLRELWQQNFENGKWNIFTILYNRKALSVRHFVPLLFVTSLVVCGSLSLISAMVAPLFWLIICSYVCVALLAAVQIGWKHGLRLVPILCLVFATLHISYGTGTLWGFARAPQWLREQDGSTSKQRWPQWA